MKRYVICLKTKLIFKSLILLAAIFFYVSGRAHSADRVYLDIDSPAWKQFVIAVPDFRNAAGKNGLPDNQAALLADQLSSLLRITAFFNVVNKKAYLDDNKASNNVSAEDIRFADWLAIGAEYLVQGNFQQRGGDLILDCRLYDVVKAEAVVGKKYVGKAADGKTMLRKFAGEILLALTGDGSVFSTRIAFVMKKGKATDILSINYDGSDLVKEIESKTILMSPRWSSEARYLAFTSFEDGNPDFYVKDMSNAAITKISSFRGINLSGGWSPDGRKVLITLSKDGNEEIYLLDFGSKVLQRLTNNYAIDVSPVWSPDGSKIAFVSNRSGSPQIYIMDGDGNNATRLTFAGNYNTSPAWSPKGDRIAYEGRVDGRFQIFTIGADGENVKQLTFDSGEGKSPAWSPDGRYLAFSKNSGGKKKIYIMTASGLNLRLLHEGTGDCVSASWSPRF
jgi:TolB protein